MYSISQAFEDCDVLRHGGHNDLVFSRLEAFVAELSPEQIREHYLDFALLFWFLPYRTSVELAHGVIEKHLLEEDAWADIYLWSFSALRMIPVADTQWVSRNYLAATLQALGDKERAEELLSESWQSFQNGSATAYGWLSGRDPNKSSTMAALEAAMGKEPEPNPFQSIEALWLNNTVVASVERNVLQSLRGDGEGAPVSLEKIDSEKGLLRWCLELVADVSGDDRQNALLGAFRACASVLGLDDPVTLIERGNNLASRQGDIGKIYECFALAALAGDERGYLPAVECLIEFGCEESAQGLANVAVWHNIDGSAALLLEILGLDSVQVNISEKNVSQSMIVQLHRIAAGLDA